jgi:hypothetical protein
VAPSCWRTPCRAHSCRRPRTHQRPAGSRQPGMAGPNPVAGISGRRARRSVSRDATEHQLPAQGSTTATARLRSTQRGYGSLRRCATRSGSAPQRDLLPQNEVLAGDSARSSATNTYRPRHGAPIAEPRAFSCANRAPGKRASNGTLNVGNSAAQIVGGSKLHAPRAVPSIGQKTSAARLADQGRP